MICLNKLVSLDCDQVQRLRDELTSSRAQLATWDERINQARAACTAWQLESEDAKRKASIAEQQRDEVIAYPAYFLGSFLLESLRVRKRSGKDDNVAK